MLVFGQGRSDSTPRDLMPEAMTERVLQGCARLRAEPRNLDSILANLDKVQADAYKR